MLLHKDEDALEEAIRATANSLSLPVEYVEKRLLGYIRSKDPRFIEYWG